MMINLEKEMQSMTSASAEVMNKMASIASVHMVFGEPVQRGDTVIIPCAEVSMGGGMGMGGGPNGNTGQKTLPVGKGTGVGGGVRSRPIAVIVMTPEGVRVQPIMDMTKVTLAVFTTAVFMLVQLTRFLRSDRGGKRKAVSLQTKK
ncbi:MAG TPA: spore germination protein GerW family protein [Ktedonobacteraceae bacterium]|nr:spore germination protein GerW family protein [Ktedonobacteraceae bacterium]